MGDVILGLVVKRRVMLVRVGLVGLPSRKKQMQTKKFEEPFFDQAKKKKGSIPDQITRSKRNVGERERAATRRPNQSTEETTRDRPKKTLS